MSTVRVAVRLYGEDLAYELDADGTTLLEGALEAGVDLPFMCEAGSCSTCRALLTAGAAAMRNNMALDDEELAAGYILACQAVPTSDAVSLDFDQEP